MAKDPSNPYAMYPDDQPAPPEGPTNGRREGSGAGSGNPGAVVGLILSILGPLAPVGVIVCLFALRREPRGLAIAGLVIGILTTLIVVVCGGFIGVGVWAVFGTREDYEEIAMDFAAISAAIENHQNTTGQLPNDLSNLGLSSDTLTDPYGDEYLYVKVSGTWRLGFNGMDGTPGSQDDIEIPAGTVIGHFQTAPYQPLQQALSHGKIMDLMQ